MSGEQIFMVIYWMLAIPAIWKLTEWSINSTAKRIERGRLRWKEEAIREREKTPKKLRYS